MESKDVRLGMFLKSVYTGNVMIVVNYEKNEDEFGLFSLGEKIIFISDVKNYKPITFSEAFKEEIEKEFEATLNEFTKEKLELVETNQGLQNQLKVTREDLTKYMDASKSNFESCKHLDEQVELLLKENKSLKQELKQTITAYDELETKKFDTTTVSTATKINSLTESNRKLQQENSKLKKRFG